MEGEECGDLIEEAYDNIFDSNKNIPKISENGKSHEEEEISETFEQIIDNDDLYADLRVQQTAKEQRNRFFELIEKN